MINKICGIVLVTILIFGLLDLPLRACTNILVTRGASRDGTVMITYSADSYFAFGYLSFYPPAKYPQGTKRDVYEWDTDKFLGQIPEAGQTYSVIGNMNEFQLTIGETTFTPRKELEKNEGLLDYGSLIYLALQRSRTAVEAITLIDQLANEFGWCSEAESFSIADPNEAWVMDIVGKGIGQKGIVWVARRVPDGYISAHANQCRIRTFPLNDPKNCLFARDVISFAREKGWFKGKDDEFSFTDAYAPVDFGALRFCELRVWRIFDRVAPSLKLPVEYAKGDPLAKPMPLWIKPDKKLSVDDLKSLMRDHYEGTEFDQTRGMDAGPFSCPYRLRPLVWKVDDSSYFNERPISSQQAAFSFISICRTDKPNPIGGLQWFGVDDTSSTVYIPIYCGNKEIPPSLAKGNGSLYDFTWDSAFWVFNFVANYSYSRYSDMIADIRKIQQELEGRFMSNQQAIEDTAAKLCLQSPELARDYLTRYTNEQMEMVMKRWKKLGEFLICKYLDGIIKKDDSREKITPGYPEPWRRTLIREKGDQIKMPPEKKMD